jgi:hypothetical protein
MKVRKLWISGLLLALAFAFTPLVRAQKDSSATQTQQSASLNDGATLTATSSTSAATITLTPTGSTGYIFIHEIDVTNCAGASAVTAAAVTSITTTNIAGGYSLTEGSGTTAGACQPTQVILFPKGLRSQNPGTNVTFVLPTFATNQTLRVNVAFSAP